MVVTTLLAHSGEVLARSGEGTSEWGNLGLLLLASGFAFYAYVYFRYRNVNKRHKHESETEATMHNLRTYDVKVGSRKGLTQPRMAGENSTEVRGALRRFF